MILTFYFAQVFVGLISQDEAGGGDWRDGAAEPEDQQGGAEEGLHQGPIHR